MTESIALLRIVLAAILGGAIGFERAGLHKEAGVRTHILVAIGATLFTMISIHGFAEVEYPTRIDYSRIMSEIVSGIGFLGAGMIVFWDKKVHGLTTAAGLWVCAAIGMAVGIGWYVIATMTTLVALFILHIVMKWIPSSTAQSEYPALEKKTTRRQMMNSARTKK